MENWITELLKPFGIVVNARNKGAHLDVALIEDIRNLTTENRVAVFRGFAPLENEVFPTFCSRFGEVLEFDFGVVNELQAAPDAKNYLYTNGAVPFHWDGAFIGRIPSFIFFHCDEAPERGSGGETLFADTTLMLKLASPELRAKWSRIEITYSTDKVVHYGGTFASPVVVDNVIRYAEPVTDLNPVRLDIDGIPADEHDGFLNDMHERLNDESVCYIHKWQAGDLLIANNFTLLHGRREFRSDAKRRIRRVNIL